MYALTSATSRKLKSEKVSGQYSTSLSFAAETLLVHTGVGHTSTSHDWKAQQPKAHSRYFKEALKDNAEYIDPTPPYRLRQTGS